jgi:hypothetical protein
MTKKKKEKKEQNPAGEFWKRARFFIFIWLFGPITA